MRLFSLLALPLVACATAPVELEAIKQAVDARATYANYKGWDMRVLQSGDAGNCAAFAHTYQHEGLSRGVPLFVTGCTLRDGTDHAFAVSPDLTWALDNRQRWVVPLSEVGCK